MQVRRGLRSGLLGKGPGISTAWLGAALTALALTAGVARGDGTVTGHVRFERIRGQPSAGYLELYETNLFLSPDGGRFVGPSARAGAPPGQPARGDGYYSLTVPAGPATLYLNQPLFFIAPRVVGTVEIENGRTITRHVDLDVDYSTYFRDAWSGWSDVWVQTFRATGASITGVSWILAGTDAKTIRASVLRDDGGSDPARWPLVSAAASRRDSVGANTDNWVRWRSGEVPTEPGQRYAIRLDGEGGGFAVYNRSKDSKSYAHGRAWDGGGHAQDFDLNVTVFTESRGTAVLLDKTTEGLGELRDGFFGGRWGQTFRATRGGSLAAVDVWAAGADGHWDLDFTFRVRQGGADGAPVGPVKTTRAAYQAAGAGLHAVSYSRDEVPLEAGQTYYVEFTNPEGFNPYVMDDAADAYDGGAAWKDGRLADGGRVDLSMTIVVWTPPGGTISGTVTAAAGAGPIEGAKVRVPELDRSTRTDASGGYEIPNLPDGRWTVEVKKAGYDSGSRADVEVRAGETTSVDVELRLRPCALEFRNGGFEDRLVGWHRYGDARGETISGEWFGGIAAFEGDRFHGNAINGCCLEGGMWQSSCAIPGHRYRVTVESNIYWIGGSSTDASSRVGIDPGGGTSPTSGSVLWSGWHRQARAATGEWRRLPVVAEATGPVLTVFLDFTQSSAGGDQWRINCFDDVVIEDLDAEGDFRRGDCDADSVLNITDAVFLLEYLFRGGGSPRCQDACDANDDGKPDITDAIFVLNHLFLGGDAPPAPGASCGPDPTADSTSCDHSTC